MQRHEVSTTRVSGWVINAARSKRLTHPLTRVVLTSFLTFCASQVFLQPATIHYDHESGIHCPLCGSIIDNAFLHPDSLDAYRDCLIDGGSSFFRSSKYINQVNFYRHIEKRRVRLFAKHFS